MKKRILGVLLCLCLCLGLLPAAALAETGDISYLDSTGTLQTYSGDYTQVASSSAAWSAGWYVVSGNVTVSDRITVTGEVHLVLTDGCTLTASKGIQVSGDGNSLTIYGQSGGTGKLIATGSDFSAGIGGGSGENGSNITINGGYVEATGGNSYSAGIGGGYKGNGSNITITGGTVFAKGAEKGGAGIGGGGSSSGTVTQILISGGNVTATGGEYSAGIGGGDSESVDGITITDGTVTATGGQCGPGIGSGSSGAAKNIRISGGSVTAQGTDARYEEKTGAGAGIGAGYYGSVDGIYITGGTVIAKGAICQKYAGKRNEKSWKDYGACGAGIGLSGSTFLRSATSDSNGTRVKNIEISGSAKVSVQGGKSSNSTYQGAGIGYCGCITGSTGSKEVTPVTTGLLTTGFIKYYTPGDTIADETYTSVITVATVGDVTVTGTYGTEITSTDITVTLADGTFASTLSGSWITNLPDGLSQSLTRDSDTQATITISGTPAAVSSAVMRITIPDSCITSGNVLPVTTNANAKFAIEKAAITGTVAITGVTAPVKAAAVNTGVSAPANTTASLKWYKGSSAVTTGTYTGSTTYKGEITITPDGVHRFDDSVAFTVNGETDWTPAKQNNGSYKLTKEFTTEEAELTGLEITEKPTNTSYKHGDTFDATGMTVKASYDDYTTDTGFTGYTVEYASGQTYLKKGDTKVTIKAGNVSVEVTGLTVDAKELSITGLTATERAYEKGNTNVTLSGGTLDGVVGSENVSLAAPYPTASVGTDAAGNDKEVTFDGEFTLDGADKDNYTLTRPTGVKVNILPKSLTDAMVVPDSQQNTYNGTEQQAKFTVKDGDNELLAGTDYTISSGDKAASVGSTALTVTGTGNYTGSASALWSLQKANPTAECFDFTAPAGLTYDGRDKNATVALKNNYSGAGEVDVKYEKDGNPVTETKDAGTYTVKINVVEGTNYNAAENLTSEAWTFTVTPTNQDAPDGLGVTAPAVSGGKGKITGTTTAMEYSADMSFASKADCSDSETEVDPGTYYVRFKADGNHNAGAAATVTVPARHTVTVTSGGNGTASADKTDATAGETVTLSFSPARGYNFDKWGDKTPSGLSIDSEGKFTMPDENVSVTAYFTPAPLTGTASISGTAKYGETLTANADGITNNTGELSYKWCRDSVEIPGATSSTYTLAEADIGKTITVKIGSSVQTGEISSAATSVVEKADGPAAPGAFTLGFTLSEDGQTFTAIIPAVEGGEYSFDGVNYSASNTKTGCAALTSYTGYVRIAKTSTHHVGEAVSSTQTSPKLTVAAPTFSPNGSSSFGSTQSVTISCATAGAKIYYTTDGTTPTATGTEYTAPLSLTDTTTVKAIAVKSDMNDSAVSTATFTKYSGINYNPTYALSVGETQHGSVSVSAKKASSGTQVTLTVKPDKGYTLETLTVLDARGNALTLKAVKIGETYSLTMPATAVTVMATFMEDNSMLNYFIDVNARDYYYDAVLWAAENGITDGVDNLHFDPNGLCTRAQAVTFLWRLAGSPEPGVSATAFKDVASGAWYEKAVLWAAEQGITLGTGDTEFSPDACCTRGQIITFLYRSQKEGMTMAWMFRNPFTDVSSDSYCFESVMWAAANSITSGTSDTTFSPNDNCTRCQIVTFMYNTVK